VPEEEIDKRYYERPYYIVPDGKSGEEAYAVIRDAMKDRGRVALAGIVFANRQHILAVEPWGKGMLGTTLRYDYEVRDEKEFFKGIASHRVPKEMVSLASHILDTKAVTSIPRNSRTSMSWRCASSSSARLPRQDHRGARRKRGSLERHRSDGSASPERQWEGQEGSSIAKHSESKKAHKPRVKDAQAKGGLIARRTGPPGLLYAAPATLMRQVPGGSRLPRWNPPDRWPFCGKDRA